MLDAVSSLFAFSLTQTPLQLSVSPCFQNNEPFKKLSQQLNFELYFEDEETFLKKIPLFERIRILCQKEKGHSIYDIIQESTAILLDKKVLPLGRLELLWGIEEQSISTQYHRYGNLGRFSKLQRDKLL